MDINQKSKLYFRHTLELFVPSHWEIVPLEEVLERIIGGGTPSKNNQDYWNGSIPWLTVKDMRTSRPSDTIDHISEAGVLESATNLIPTNTVIMATRIGLGKVVRVPYAAIINQDLKALITLPEIDKGYLELWLLSISNYLQSVGSGTTVKGIRLEQVRSLPFPLAPVSEQKRIVVEIEKQFSRLDKAVANLQRVKANLKRYKAAVLKAAVEGKLTEEWRKKNSDVEPASKLLKRILVERRTKWEKTEVAKMKAKGKVPKDDRWKNKYKEPVSPEQMVFPDFPKGWVWASIDQIASSGSYSITDGPFGSNLKTEHYRTSGPRVIRLQNIKDGVFADESAHITKEHFEKLRKHQIHAGDLVIASLGVNPPRACIIPSFVGPAIVKADCIRFKPHSEFNPFYLNAALNSQPTRQRVSKQLQGIGRPRISLGKMRSITLPIPPPDEQCVIVSEIDQKLSFICAAEAQVDTDLKKSERLRQSILQKAFSGELVRPLPEDKPASVLLERIRKAAVAVKPKKKKRKDDFDKS